ncbi:MAG: FG-GAP repeat protein, partial [Anaerolineales bacterium]|nr:FG-GAP repeat protein [Anaerolineales bacterium]
LQEDSQLIVVDNEVPRFGWMTPHHGELIGGGVSSYVIGGTSSDVTTWVDEISLDLPYIGTQTITESETFSPWAYTWELPADGIYTLYGRSTDFVGHVSGNDDVTVMIDNTAPSTDVNLVDGAVFGKPENSDVITITLAGTASENLSGLTRVQISTDGGPWREVWTLATATVTNTTFVDHNSLFTHRAVAATWDAVWTLPNVETVQGYHNLRIRAFDQAGNWPTYLERNIIIDVIPPTDDLLNQAYLYEFPHVVANAPHTFQGVTNDVGNVPQPSRPAELVGNLDSINDATIWLGLSDIGQNDGGVNAAWIGDFNGDRRGDLLVGLPAADDGAGRVAVVYGRSGNWPVPDEQEMLADAKTAFVGLPGAGIGAHALPAGDVNGDGLADLLIGDPANNRVYLIFGQNKYLGNNIILDGPQSGIRVSFFVPDGQIIGDNIGAAGDVNGDGLADFFIGATGTVDYAYLILGQGAGWQDEITADRFAAAKISGAGAASLSGIGDVDGDFYDEFAIGANNTLYLFAGRGSFAPQAGAWYSIYSSPFTTFTSNNAFPETAALGDVNGDHIDDFIYTSGTSQILVLGDETRDASWNTQTYGYGTGFLAAPGDVDNDGLNDILIGGNNTAYLVLGSDLGVAKATIVGVAAAASAPYAAGADLNSDGSSDLLLVPTATSAQATVAAETGFADLPPTWVPQMPEANLETYVGSTTWPSEGADAYVNGDGVCFGLTPCYSAIQTAVDATSTYDLIIVQPGVYASFTVNGSSHDNLTIRGVDPDAVIIDANGSSYAAHIQDADSVRLEKMTLRNASYGVQLVDAGVGGHEDAQLAERTILDHVLIYDTNAHAVYIDRSSTITVSNSTLVRAGSHIGVDMSDSFDATINVGWQAETNPSMPHAFYDGGGLAVFDDILFYCTGGGMRQCQWKHIEDSNWFTPWAPPTDLEAGSTLAAGSDGNFYAVAAPGWDDMPESPEQVVTLWENGVIVSERDGHLLAVPQLGQGFMEWDGSSWTYQSSPDLPYANYASIAENPTNGDVAFTDPWDGLFIWDGVQFTTVLTDDVTAGPIAYTSSGNLFAVRYIDETPRLEKFDGTQWTTVTTMETTNYAIMETDSQNNLYVAEGADVFGYNGTSLSSYSRVGSVTNTVKSLAYNETINKLFACSGEGIARYDSGWTMLPPVTTGAGTFQSGSCETVTFAGQIYASGEWFEDTSEGTIRINMARWDDFDEKWEPIGANELCVYGEPQWCEVEEVIGGKLGIYVVGVEFYDLGDDNYSYLGQKISHYHFSTSVYSTTLNAWHTVAPPPAIGPGASMAGTDDGTLALIAGNGDDRVYTYDIVANQWDSKDTLETGGTQDPINVTASAMTFADGWLYAITNGGEFCSSSNGEYWSCFSEGDIDEGTMGIIDGGASLTYDPKFETFYAFTGGNGRNMLRYNTNSDTWELLPTERFTPSPIKPGAGLVFMPGEQGNSLYVVEG